MKKIIFSFALILSSAAFAGGGDGPGNSALIKNADTICNNIDASAKPEQPQKIDIMNMDEDSIMGGFMDVMGSATKMRGIFSGDEACPVQNSNDHCFHVSFSTKETTPHLNYVSILIHENSNGDYTQVDATTENGQHVLFNCPAQ